MLATNSIPSENLYKVVLYGMQDLPKNQVINPITQKFHMVLDLCLYYQQT